MTDAHLFNNISLGGRGGTNPGQLKISSGGIQWKKQGGGKAVEVDRTDIVGVTWMKVPRTNQLSVLIKGGPWYKFTGFRDQDLSTLTNFFQSHGITPVEKQLSVSGRNWGEVDLNGNMLTFLVGSKQAFEVSLADVSQTQMQGKNDVILEFHVDDTTGANEKDSLMELSFHIPNNNTQYVGDENRPPAQVFRDLIVQRADVGAGGEEAVVTFEGIAILTPRGRYSVELHLSFLRLQGQANDFKIQYSSVVRLFLLPKYNQPHTFVVVTLDPPIRKGQTLYPHIVLQFDTDFVVQSNLSLSEDLLYTKYKDKLESSYKGLIHEVFTTILRGLSAAKVTRPGKFRSCQDGYAVKSSLKAEDGVLYPLEKSFFFLPKPPTLILHEEIDYVEFERHAAGGSNMHYFDLLIRLKTEQEHLFRNIQRNEYHNLFDFISGKGLKIMNLGDMQAAKGVAAVLQNDDDDAVDPHLARIRNEAGSLALNIIQQAEAEVKRLDQLKASKMKELFFKKQSELDQICKKSHMEIPSQPEMENFINLINLGEIDHADLLMSLDEQISRAKEEASSRKAIMEKVERWMLARDEERWLEEYSMDENRYSVRRGAHKNLQRAERARVIVNKIPVLVASLVTKTESWEEERNKVFLYDGVPLLAMLEEYNLSRQEREEEKQSHRMAFTTQEKKAPSHVVVEQENLVGSRPSTSSRRLSNKSLNGGFSNAAPLNRRLSLGLQQLGTNSINSANLGVSYIKEGRKIQGQKMFLRPDLTCHLRDEAASVVSSFSGPLSP